MKTERLGIRDGGINHGKWLTGAVAGAVGAFAASIVLFATDAFELSELGIEAVGILFMPGAVFGLLYAGLASIERLRSLTSEPQTGVVVGLLYGIAFSLTTLVGGSFSVSSLLAGVTFGVTIGVVYAISPST